MPHEYHEPKALRKFIDALAGPSGCNMTGEGLTMQWRCDNSSKRPLTRKILKSMPKAEIIEVLMDTFAEGGGHCDCEVLFNILK